MGRFQSKYALPRDVERRGGVDSATDRRAASGNMGWGVSVSQVRLCNYVIFMQIPFDKLPEIKENASNRNLENTIHALH